MKSRSGATAEGAGTGASRSGGAGTGAGAGAGAAAAADGTGIAVAGSLVATARSSRSSSCRNEQCQQKAPRRPSGLRTPRHLVVTGHAAVSHNDTNKMVKHRLACLRPDTPHGGSGRRGRVCGSHVVGVERRCVSVCGSIRNQEEEARRKTRSQREPEGKERGEIRRSELRDGKSELNNVYCGRAPGRYQSGGKQLHHGEVGSPDAVDGLRMIT